MLAHHAETLRRTTEYFRSQPNVRGLLLGGSLAHDFASPESDVDVMIVVSDGEFEERAKAAQTCFFSREPCTYDGGYVDGKYIAPALLRDVACRGSEPARFAFKDAQVLFDESGELPALISAAARFPSEGTEDRIRRFQAQFEAWQWYTSEAARRRDAYLMSLAVAKLILFGGRIVLAHNQLLYPYHKWFLRVLESAPDKPPGLVPAMRRLAQDRNAADVDAVAAAIRGFRSWNVTHSSWPPLFMEDSELNWRTGFTPIDDV